MADRFPSIEDIDEGQTGDSYQGGDYGDDQGDFLAREKAVLGDDAAQFSTTDIPSVSVEDGDLLGGDQANGANDDMSHFQSSFPAVDTHNEQVAPGGTITGSTTPYLPGAPTTATHRAPSPSAIPPEDEPEVIKTWRAARDEQIAKREEAAAASKEQTIREAQQSIDEFYENYNNKRDKGVKQTRTEAEEFLAARDDTTAGGTSWERIGKLVDVKAGAGKTGVGAVAGKERFRELLGSLIKDENAPGAKGY